MYHFPSLSFKKRLVISIALASLTLVVLWLGFPGSQSQLARDFEECVEQVQAQPLLIDERSALMTNCNARFAGRRKAGGGYTYFDFMQNRNSTLRALIRQQRSASRSIASIWFSSTPSGERLSRLTWQKDRTNSFALISKACVNLSGHRRY